MGELTVNRNQLESMHKRVLLVGRGNSYGLWGAGPNKYEAIENLSKAGGNIADGYSMFICFSPLPFNNDPDPSKKAVAYIDAAGGISYRNCSYYEELVPATKKGMR